MTALSRIPLHPLLFAAYAVLFLYAANLDEVLPVDAVEPLARVVAAAAAATVVLALVFRGARRGAVVAAALVAAFLGYGHVSPVLAGLGLGDPVQLAAWGLVVVLAVIYAIAARGSLPTATAALNVAALLLVGMTLATIVPYEAGRAARPEGVAPVRDAAQADRATAPDAAGFPQRDIYFLVFDRYGSEEAIQRRFGLDNDLYEWLRSQGFQVPANSHANYRATDFSLAATLNMRFLDELTERIGRVSGDRTPAHQLLAEHQVGRFLRAQGYRYYQLASWFEPSRAISIADETLVMGSTSEFESVFNDTTIVPALQRVLGLVGAEPTFRDRHREATLFELRQLRRIATAPGPKFVFAHILLPHDPYVFRADGSALPEAEAKATDERDLYAAHLAFANAQIRDIVGYLLDGPEETRPIVIIEGDEGPLACQSVDCVSNTPDYLRIRLGNLIAMYLPGVDVELPDTFTSVNTFRLVLRAYFGADLPPLPDRSFTWPDNDHIYDFRDVTDLIAPGGG